MNTPYSHIDFLINWRTFPALRGKADKSLALWWSKELQTFFLCWGKYNAAEFHGCPWNSWDFFPMNTTNVNLVLAWGETLRDHKVNENTLSVVVFF